MKENKQASKELKKMFHVNMMGVVMKCIYLHHLNRNIQYELSEEAESAFEDICEKYNDQFNLKWSGIPH